jgi:membrane-associated phospholipid phosphatase
MELNEPTSPASEAMGSGLPTLRMGLAMTGAAIVVLIGCFLADQAVYDWVHANWNYFTRPIPDHLKLATRLMRSLEDWGENVFIACILYAMWVLDRRHRSRVVMLIATALLATLPVELVKRLVGRERPDQTAGRTVLYGPSYWNEGGDFQSFPSGHTASGAAYSGSLSSFYPPVRPVAVGLALGCGASRIWKERHFLSDCWAGGILGFAIAFYLPRWRPVRQWCNVFDERASAWRFSFRAGSGAITPASGVGEAVRTPTSSSPRQAA